MRLVTTSQVQALRQQLSKANGFRVAEIEVDIDPFDFARTGAALVDRAVAFSSPGGVRLAGLGTAWRAAASGEARFKKLKAQIDDLDAHGVKGFVGFSFLPTMLQGSIWDGYEPAEMFIPRIGIEGVESGSLIRIAVPEGDPIDPTLDLLASMRRPQWSSVVDVGDHSTESRPPVSEWVQSVADALGFIERGDIEKVVLARSVVVHSDAPPEILRMFRQLVVTYPQCYNFAWKSGDGVFMGASPELLASVSGRSFRSNPLAGTAPRGEGSVQDEAIGAALLASVKDRIEHAFVVDAMVERLDPLTGMLAVSETPTLKKMESVQHLSTVIEGTLGGDTGLLDLVDAVHPTPAVGGVPTKAAVDVIGRLESIDRGWYTGGVGWLDADGNGAIALGLRCGLVRGRTTNLFAGAGIVAGSRPDSELLETRLKLEPLLKLLTAT
jgi:isochorismate synthase